MKKIKSKNKIIIITAVILIAALTLLFSIIWRKQEKTADDPTKIKDNVYAITDETEESKLPIAVMDDQLMFIEEPQYTEGDVIVSGITDVAPTGFIRKVVSVEESKEGYVVKTENAYLTDVFEEAHVTKTFSLSEDGVEEIHDDNTKQGEKIGNTGNLLCMSLPFVLANNDEETENVTPSEEETEYMFSYEVDYDIDEHASVAGEVGFNILLEFNMEIENGTLFFELVGRTETGGEISLICSESSEVSFEKELFSKDLPNIQFFVGFIPIVITNELSSAVEGTVALEGSIEATVELKSENVVGVQYNSESYSLNDINESNYFSDGLQWETEAKVSGEQTAGVYLHFISKLYGFTGVDLSIGIAENIKGEVIAAQDDETAKLVGFLDMTIGPEIKGDLVVTIPIFEIELADIPLFEIELEPFWESHWNSGENWEQELLDLKPVELNNVYTTQYGEGSNGVYPQFQFSYPDNWKITEAQIHEQEYGQIFPPTVNETVVLENDRGAKIYFADLQTESVSEYGRIMYEVNVEKYSDAAFAQDYPDSNFIIAKMKITGELCMDTDVDFTDVDGNIEYILVPETTVGEYGPRNCGQYLGFPFMYFNYKKDYYGFFTQSPEGGFTKEEEKEVIAILNSLREVQ